MLLNVDFKSLEVVTAAYLSQDEVMCEEVRNGVDFHGLNQEKFNLPERVVAKVLMFRIIYGGTQFAQDPDFQHVSKSQKYWDKVIEKFYDKYKGLRAWHTSLMREATTTGRVTMPTGRFYYFSSVHGRWPRTQILNYPVQGLAADLVAVARVSLRRRLKEAKLSSLIVSSIHDSIVLDCPNDPDEISKTMSLMESVINDVPMNFKKLWKVDFNLPLKGDLSLGHSKGKLEKWDSSSSIAKLLSA